MCSRKPEDCECVGSCVKPHKHAAVIKAWADGAQIQVRCPRSGRYDNQWLDLGIVEVPTWLETLEYRVKPAPDPYAELKAARAEGKIVEIISTWGVWRDLSPYRWDRPVSEYRIKPEPKPDVVQYFRANRALVRMGPKEALKGGFMSYCSFGRTIGDNVKVVFDGESGELKSVEKI
jgi:hypothetical protein